MVMVRDKINKIRTIIPLVIHGLIPIGLVLMTGDAGSALIFLIMFIGMLFFARINIGYFLAGFCALIVGFVACLEVEADLRLAAGADHCPVLPGAIREHHVSTK